MVRNSWKLMALFALSFISFFGYSYLTRPEDVAEAKSPATTMALAAQRSLTDTKPDSPVAYSETDSSRTISPDTVAKWLVEATGDDPKARAIAIAALAAVPKSEAIPVLQKVLNSGEAQIDRPLALKSLRTLALQQGDADGAIRNVVRQAIYHGSDETVVRSAQTVLDEIEGSLDQGAGKGSSGM